jgi:hypothetical protein
VNTKLVESKLEEIKKLADCCLAELRGNNVTVDPPADLRAEESHEDAIVMPSDAQPDFAMPVRPFMKGFGELSGKSKFVLILAWIAKGKVGQPVELSKIQEVWDSMVGLLGVTFNRYFTQQAKDLDWVETSQRGVYSLRPRWAEALRSK